jgi:hypothetical protein
MSGVRLLYTAAGVAGYVGMLRLAHMTVSSMKESPSNAALHLTIPHKMIISPENAKSLKEHGLVVIDNVMTAKELEATRTEIIRVIEHTEEFVADPNDDLSIRSDVVTFISEKLCDTHKSPIATALLDTLRLLRSIPNELTTEYGYDAKRFGVPLSNQLACYDGQGTHYVAHRDAPETVGTFDWVFQPGIYDRELTMVLYLNESSWDSSTTDGENCDGNLRCYLEADKDDYTGVTAKRIVNIEPIGGRLVIFDSKRVLHAVLPTSQRRIALTSWIGGSHSRHEWMRNFCIPFSEIDWISLKQNLFSFGRS